MKKINFKEIDFKKLAMLHCEKVVLGCFVACLLYFIYQTTQTSVYGVTPKQIGDQADQVTKKVLNSEWKDYLADLNATPEKPRPEVPQPALPKVAEDFMLQPPNLAMYGQSTWFAPVVKPDVKRRDITPRYPVEELAVSYGYGPFAVRDPNFRPDQPFEQPVAEAQPKRKGRPDPKADPRVPPGGEAMGPRGPAPKTAAGRGAQRALDQLRAGAGRNGPPGPRAGPPGPGRPPQMDMFGLGPRRGGLGSVTVGQGGKVEGRRWVVITGAVPFDKQEKAIWESINATQQNFVAGRDDLQYVGFHVKRAEVSSSTEEIDWDKIQPLSFEKLQAEISIWEENPLEVIDESVLDPSLNVPLPPLVGRAWDAEEIIHKRIPVLKEEDLIKQAEAALAAEKEAATKKEESDLPPGVFRNPNAETRRPQGYEMQIGRSRLGPGSTAPRETPYRMFRFFDFEVQPGKSYQYRVQLIFKNPNFGMSEKEIEDLKAGKDRFITSPWSAPSRTVVCPLDSNLLVGPVTARTPAKEPEATIMVRQWNHKDGVNAVKKFAQLARGQVSNFVGQQVKVSNPRDESVMDTKMDFTTNMLLADFIGGQKLHARGPKTEPGDVLFVKADGSLVMKSELEDMRDFKSEQERTQELDEEAQPAEQGYGIGNPLFPQGEPIDPLGARRPPRGGS